GVTIRRIKGKRVVLGIEAPDGVRIIRAEIEPREPQPAES
ncbi:MAG: carbon storage regulator, partial [Bdellovibrionales bacterium]|nr:carbon storage regulator [Bdellovibrionales bacterium]